MNQMHAYIVTLASLLLYALAPAAAVERRDSAAPAARELGVVVDLSDRQLDIRVNGRLYGTYAVAVGQPGHRTPTGTDPGDPDNPMGRVKIFFNDLLYIHGTDATHTLGEPASHGCIRMRIEEAMELARLVMERGGAERSGGWYDDVRSNETETYEVAIPDPPVLRISD